MAATPGDKSTWLSHVNEWAARGVPAKDSAPPMTDTPGAYAVAPMGLAP